VAGDRGNTGSIAGSIPGPIPERVARARALAGSLGFGQASEDDVGRLLRTLAAAVPRGGRVLEIGTGTGVGTAWIVDGLEPRSDVEVVSVEVETSRAERARSIAWPGWVTIVVGDVLEELARLGTFDLVFADAQAGKWTGLDRTVAAVKPGGLLVVDDMLVGPTAPPDLAERQAGVRAALFAMAELVPVELAWSSGVIVAARRR